MCRFRPEAHHDRLDPIAEAAWLSHAEGASWARSPCGAHMQGGDVARSLPVI
jgi:hypothetical protein